MSLKDKIKLIIIKDEMKNILNIFTKMGVIKPVDQIFSPADPWGEEKWNE